MSLAGAPLSEVSGESGLRPEGDVGVAFGPPSAPSDLSWPKAEPIPPDQRLSRTDLERLARLRPLGPGRFERSAGQERAVSPASLGLVESGIGHAEQVFHRHGM